MLFLAGFGNTVNNLSTVTVSTGVDAGDHLMVIFEKPVTLAGVTIYSVPFFLN